MKKIITFLVILSVLIVGLSGCKGKNNNEPPVQQSKTNAYWTRDADLFRFSLKGKNYTIGSNLAKDLIYDTYVNNSGDTSLLVKLGFSSEDSPYVYYIASDDAVYAVYCRTNDSYISTEIRFKIIDGKASTYKFKSLTENADFQWLGTGIDCKPEDLVTTLGEPTSVEKNDNGTIAALIYKGADNEYLRVDFLGNKLWGIKMITKI